MYFKSWKEVPTSVDYTQKLSFQIKEEIKTFQDKELSNSCQYNERHISENYIQNKKKNKHNRTAQERINLTGRVDKQMKVRKDSNIISTAKHQTSKMNKRERNKHRIFKTTRRTTE
jgi:hypothetical protein